MADLPVILDGVLVIDKGEGPTSHDIVSIVKRTLKVKKVGHLGTLDPLATGVLPLIINSATKFARFIDGGVKEYTATMGLGVSTDSYDSQGKVTGRGDASGVTREDVERVLESFLGEINQVPPMFSAVKVKGKALYKSARRGEVVERTPKRVTIHSIELLSFEGADGEAPGDEVAEVTFRVRTSKGTYVRSICHDTGEILGCGGHMTKLRRTRSGYFSLDDAITIDELVKNGDGTPLERAEGSIISISEVLENLKTLPIDDLNRERLERGRRVVNLSDVREPSDGFFTSLREGDVIRFVNSGEVAGLGDFRGGRFNVEKVLRGAACPRVMGHGLNGQAVTGK